MGKLKMHCTPRTYAILFLQENIVSINEPASILGHSSPKITLEHYSSVINVENIDLGANFSLFSYNPGAIEKKKVD